MLYVVHSTQLTNINSGESSDSSTFKQENKMKDKKRTMYKDGKKVERKPMMKGRMAYKDGGAMPKAKPC